MGWGSPLPPRDPEPGSGAARDARGPREAGAQTVGVRKGSPHQGALRAGGHGTGVGVLNTRAGPAQDAGGGVSFGGRRDFPSGTGGCSHRRPRAPSLTLGHMGTRCSPCCADTLVRETCFLPPGETEISQQPRPGLPLASQEPALPLSLPRCPSVLLPAARTGPAAARTPVTCKCALRWASD